MGTMSLSLNRSISMKSIGTILSVWRPVYTADTARAHSQYAGAHNVAKSGQCKPVRARELASTPQMPQATVASAVTSARERAKSPEDGREREHDGEDEPHFRRFARWRD